MNLNYKNNIFKFLIGKQWEKISEDEKYIILKAPDNLGFKEPYYLKIANNDSIFDFQDYQNRITKIISEIYDIKIVKLNDLFNEDNTILSLKIYDKDLDNGKIPFNKFEQIIEKFKKILLNNAAFEIIKKVLLENIPNEANLYLNLCKFLNTEKGSLITNIELPKNEIIFESPLFPEKQITANEINENLVKVIDFVVNDVFPKEEFSDQFIDDHKQIINYNLLTEIENFYFHTSLENISFKFLNNESEKVIDSVEITEAKVQNLHVFNNIVRDKIFQEKEVEFFGYIQELKSKDPETDKNIIKVVGLIDNLESIVSIKLPSDKYKSAVDAHKTKKKIRIKGKIKEEITQKKMIFLESFEID